MQKIDAKFILWLLQEHVPISIVFTKIDKAKQADLHILKTKYENLIMTAKYSLPMFFSTSVDKKRGREEVLEFIKGEVIGHV
jgi:GTP-binding protein